MSRCGASTPTTGSTSRPTSGSRRRARCGVPTGSTSCTPRAQASPIPTKRGDESARTSPSCTRPRCYARVSSHCSTRSAPTRSRWRSRRTPRRTGSSSSSTASGSLTTSPSASRSIGCSGASRSPIPTSTPCASSAPSPTNSVAFEDSEAGTQSAVSAGLFVIAAPGPMTITHDLSAAHMQIDGFDDVTLADVARALEGARS